MCAAAIAYGGYRYWNDHQRPVPVAVVPRLAPEGIYFLLDYYGVHTEHGVTGWTPGQQVKTVAGKTADQNGVWVTDGQLQAQVDPTILTREIDLADKLRSTDSTVQAKASQQAIAARDQQLAQEKRDQAAAARAASQAPPSYGRSARVYATPANPLDRDAKATN